jgi:hypothetical protein
MAMSDDRLWIQEAIQKPGSLRAYVQRKYGKRGFKITDGKVIDPALLRRLARVKGTTGKRARLALTLRGLCPYCKGRRHPCKRYGTRRCPARMTRLGR